MTNPVAITAIILKIDTSFNREDFWVIKFCAVSATLSYAAFAWSSKSWASTIGTVALDDKLKSGASGNSTFDDELPICVIPSKLSEI